ncbi:MAG: hypothetical protein M3P39_02110, partial [Actinomycetota bacterium]|nr:hypothetical protein [Actinomycetota bacterium]
VAGGRLAHEPQPLLALAAVDRGEREEGLRLVREATARNPGWHALLDRLPPHIAPSAPAVLAALAPPADGG